MASTDHLAYKNLHISCRFT